MKAPILRLFRSEAIKWWRDWVLLAALLVPFTQALSLSVLLGLSGDRATMLGAGFVSWYKINAIAWNLLFMPLSVSLVASLSWELENRSKAWKHMLAMPVSRTMHYSTKAAAHLALGVLAHLTLGACVLAGGVSLRAWDSSLPMGPMELSLAARLLLYSLVSALPPMAVHAWWASRFPGLASNLGLAAFGSWATFQLNAQVPLIGLSPWGLASQITSITLRAQLPTWGMYAMALGSAFGLWALGGMDYHRRIPELEG